MTNVEPAEQQPLFDDRDRRILLWVVAATVCWRWLLAVRAPLPGEDAVLDLWVARELGGGDLTALQHVWSGPLWSALITPGVLLGFEPFECAMVLGAVLTGLGIVPAAIAAQRWQRSRGAGAGTSVALLMASVPQPALSTAGGAATPVQLLLAGLGLLALSRRRFGLGAVLVGVAALDAMRGGLPGLLPLGMLAAAVIAAIGLCRLHVRLRDLLLTLAVAAMFWLAWNGGVAGSKTVIVERHLGEFVGERLAPDETVASDLPRVLYYSGRRPEVFDEDELRALLGQESTGAVVVRRNTARQLRAAIDARFSRYRLSQRFADLVAAHGVVLLLPR